MLEFHKPIIGGESYKIYIYANNTWQLYLEHRDDIRRQQTSTIVTFHFGLVWQTTRKLLYVLAGNLSDVDLTFALRERTHNKQFAVNNCFATSARRQKLLTLVANLSNVPVSMSETRNANEQQRRRCRIHFLLIW